MDNRTRNMILFTIVLIALFSLVYIPKIFQRMSYNDGDAAAVYTVIYAIPFLAVLFNFRKTSKTVFYSILAASLLILSIIFFLGYQSTPHDFVFILGCYGFTLLLFVLMAIYRITKLPKKENS